MSHQEGEETYNDERQEPLSVIPLVVQEEDSSERRRRHNQDLRRRIRMKHQMGNLVLHLQSVLKGGRFTLLRDFTDKSNMNEMEEEDDHSSIVSGAKL